MYPPSATLPLPYFLYFQIHASPLRTFRGCRHPHPIAASSLPSPPPRLQFLSLPACCLFSPYGAPSCAPLSEGINRQLPCTPLPLCLLPQPCHASAPTSINTTFAFSHQHPCLFPSLVRRLAPPVAPSTLPAVHDQRVLPLRALACLTLPPAVDQRVGTAHSPRLASHNLFFLHLLPHH